MPELPEVETIAGDLDSLLKGASIKNCQILFDKIVATGADLFKPMIVGAKIVKVRRLAKWIHFELEGPGLSGPGDMMVHLRMTGQFCSGPWQIEPENFPPHVRLAFELEGFTDEALFYRDIRKFGRLYLFSRPDFLKFLEKLKLGPDPFEINEEIFHERITKKNAHLKAVLLDQKVLSGLGNIYVDESLFAAALSPLRAADSLSAAESKILFQEIKRILNAAIKARGSTVSNYQGLKGAGAFQNQHKVYGKGGEPCPRCFSVLEKLTVGGRGSTYCSHCQK